MGTAMCMTQTQCTTIIWPRNWCIVSNLQSHSARQCSQSIEMNAAKTWFRFWMISISFKCATRGNKMLNVCVAVALQVLQNYCQGIRSKLNQSKAGISGTTSPTTAKVHR